MRNIILIIFSFLFILTGCSNTSNIEVDLLSTDYPVTVNNNDYIYTADENSIIMISLDDNNEISSISVEVSPSSYQSIQLMYNLSSTEWSANYWDQASGEISINPNDAYAYIEAVAPIATEGLIKLTNSQNISITTLESGDKKKVDELIEPKFIFSNLEVVDSTYTNLILEEEFAPGEYFLQVNFELYNNTQKSTDLNGVTFEICYQIPNGTSCASLNPMNTNDTQLYLDTLEPKETINIQMTAIVPKSASQFYVTMKDADNKIYVETESIDKSN